MATFLGKINRSVEAEKALEHQLQFQKKLNSITNKIHSAKDTNDILMNLQGEILGLFDADRITIYVVDGIRKQIVSRFKTGGEVNEIRVPIAKGSVAGYCAATGKVINVLNAYDTGELEAIHPQLGFDQSWDAKTGYRTRQILAAPIMYNKYLLGVIQLINKKSGETFTDADCTSALDIARILGIAFFINQRVVQKTKTTRFDYLITNNIISDKDLTEAMSRARKTERSVESVLISD
ncbi:MAG: GAF domain-containing protein, partial [Deltaproteobacteria bacterium]